MLASTGGDARDEWRDEWRDRVELADLLARFAMALDTCDWAMYRSVFTDQIELDYSSWRAEHRGPRSADEWVARAARLFPGLTASRHALTNVVVSIDGTTPDTARVIANVSADHVLVDGDTTEVFTLNGRYHDSCVRTAHGWRISGKRLVVGWSVGDRSLLVRAADRVTAGVADLRTALPG